MSRKLVIKILMVSNLSFLMLSGSFAQRQSVNVNGRQIYFDVAGNGPPVLVFHGWTQVGADWKVLLSPLESQYQVIYVDLPGHGKSGTLGEGFSIQRASKEMANFVDMLELRGARAIGYSYGGMLLLEMLVQDPRLLREVVLISTPHNFNGADQQPVLLDSLPLAFQQSLISKHYGGETQVRALFNPALDYSVLLTESDVKPVFIPTLIIQGENDPIVPVSQARELSDWLVAGRLWVIKGKGHDVISSDNAGTFQKRLISFFADF